MEPDEPLDPDQVELTLPGTNTVYTYKPLQIGEDFLRHPDLYWLSVSHCPAVIIYHSPNDL